MEPVFFETPAQFRDWLAKNHARANELLVGYHKKATDKASMTWPESVDEALCYGWIDGVRRSLGDESYCIRFTPRRTDSIWSARNIARVAALEREGRMKAAGRAAFAARKPDKTGVYSFESDVAPFTSEEEARLKSDAAAWADWESRAPSYRKAAAHWVLSAKRPATREKRLSELIDACRDGVKVKPLPPPGENRKPRT